MYCTLCGHENETGHVGFKALCENCDRYLHTCIQCALYDFVSQRCRSLTTEPVRSRDDSNYCEEYLPNNKPGRSAGPEGSKSSGDFGALFGSGDE